MKIYYVLILAAICFMETGCKKYLEAKTDKSLTVPASISDLQALLNNVNDLNLNTPTEGEIASDNLYLTDDVWSIIPLTDRNAYIWGKDLFNDDDFNDWSYPYIMVNYANVVLDQLTINADGTRMQKNNIRGEALFFRAFAFFNLLQEFAKPYDSSSAASSLGIALRLSSDINIKTVRAPLDKSYLQVLRDLKEAASLLNQTQTYLTLPTRTAAYALLSRCYLSMRDYKNALLYSDSALDLKSDLINFNLLDSGISYPFARFNQEVIFHTCMSYSGTLGTNYGRIDSMLLDTYEYGDLRRSLFFRKNTDGSSGFRGSYNNSSACFSGLATDELFLIKAECLARQGQIEASIKVLNRFLKTRWINNSYTPIPYMDKDSLLDKILGERRKELIFRGLRWSDLRRLNFEKDKAVTIHRKINEINYALEPQSMKYVFPIPIKIIEMTGISQNDY